MKQDSAHGYTDNEKPLKQEQKQLCSCGGGDNDGHDWNCPWQQEQPSEEKEEHFLIGKQIRYRYVDWEVGSFTPWCRCNHSDLKKILEDNSIDVVEFKP